LFQIVNLKLSLINGEMMLWFACTTLTILAAGYTLMPLFREPRHYLAVDLLAETELDRLSDRKAVIYRSLRDLEFEHGMGRLSETDFKRLEAEYKNEAASILQKLDQLDASEKLDEKIEKDIASRKSKLYTSDSKPAQESLRCPSCGAEVIPGKKFCADCGRQI
jgi:hypothetical protein